MSPHHRRCIRAGRRLTREQLDRLVATYVDEWDCTPKGAIHMAGQLRAVALACVDCYWKEKAAVGFMEAINDLERLAEGNQ